MNRRLVRQALGGCALLALLGWSVGRDAPAEEPTTAKTQVVILNNMQLLKGSVSRSPNGFVVEHAAGRLVIPPEEVRVIGKDLPDAYRRMIESYPEPTAATHYQLALWGWSHHLKQDARNQLVMALDRDPDHEPARDMLTRIDEQAAAERRRAAAAKLKPPPPRIVNGIELPEVESLAGLSRDTAAQFTRRIQPLVINKCGNASCHGPNTPTGFRLEQLRGAGAASRMHTERNLAAVLEQIDQNQVNSSPLLTVPMRSHGGLNKAMFFGPTGERQLEMLKSWARSASKELTHDRQLAEQRSSVLGAKPNFPKSPPSQASIEHNEDDISDAARSALAASSSYSNAAEDIAEDIDAEDAFDPEAFNRRYHGKRATAQKTRKAKR